VNEGNYMSLCATAPLVLTERNLTFLYESETCSLTPTEKPSLRIRDNRMLGKIFRPETGQEINVTKWHSEICYQFCVHQLVLG